MLLIFLTLMGGCAIALLFSWFFDTFKYKLGFKIPDSAYYEDVFYCFKKLLARVWLRQIPSLKNHRLLDVFDFHTDKYEKQGVVAAELETVWDQPRQLSYKDAFDGLSFVSTDGCQTFLKISINRKVERQAQVSLLFILPDGTFYRLPGAPDTLVSNTDGKESFNAGGVKFQLIEGMRKWRVIFNGIAHRTSNNKTEEVHLRMNFIWTSFSRPFEFRRERSHRLLAESIAREGFEKDWGFLCESDSDGIDQWGTLSGTYQETSSVEENELYLRGLRQRRWGLSTPTLERQMDVIAMGEDGHYFYVCASSDPSKLSKSIWGHHYHPSGFLDTIETTDVDLEHFYRNSALPKHFGIHFATRRGDYRTAFHLLPCQFEEFSGRPWNRKSIFYPCQWTVNARQGRGFAITTELYNGECPLGEETSLVHLAAPNRSPLPSESEKLVLHFGEEACRFESLVGGKGASLALLSSTIQQASVESTVPAGLCVTLGAWNVQTSKREDLKAQFKNLEAVANGVVEGKLEDLCSRASQSIADAPVDAAIQEAIRDSLKELFGDEFESKRFAVRSSAIGEDSEELSSAGQNATFLGCRGFDSILKGLQQCWASLLAYQSVQYRHQHSEPLVPGMGVVIQEMVDAEAAGVLFTVNPNDGDPSKMILTANFGLGESVVSASADPDTIILKRTYSGEVSIEERTLGAKHSKVVLTDDGTTEQELDPEQSAALCLSDGIVLRIGRLGLYLEKVFGGPRDLEFAVIKDTLYLLQARPVTSLDAWSDYELKHEFDSAILTAADHVTKANTGEVFPGATSPLGISTVGRTLDAGVQCIMMQQFGRLYEANPWFVNRMTQVHQWQVFLNVIEAFQRDIDEQITDNNRAVDMALFGHLVTTEEMHRIGIERYGAAGFEMKFKRYLNMIKHMFLNDRRIRYATGKFSNYTFSVDHYVKPDELYADICARLPLLQEIGRIHLEVSSASSISQMITFIILLDGSNEWTPKLYSEIAQLLTSISNVESADVPVALKVLAKAIAESDEAGEFTSNPVDVATVWLETHPGTPGKLYRDFIERHGHRSVKELDVMTETWGINPRSLVGVLQSMAANPSSCTASDQTDVDWTKGFESCKPSKLRALKFAVPRCRQAVVAREKTKSLLISTIHVFRLAYRRLAQLLVWEGKLPDAELVFFLTHGELDEVIHSKSAGLIAKANRRRKLHRELEHVVFPEICRGVPKPDQHDTTDLRAEGTQLTGTPVYKGVVKATVRVALNLEQAKEIKAGDILITRCTDIGWSPYFPLLSGVVTELGGLISHGAVVAREYGLPAIVGCERATQVFRSGDVVVLDGIKGTITRVQSD